MEALNKSKCVRCGKPNKNGGKGGRCTSCLKKLAANKKKPGHWQRAQTKADDALRRQDGKNGTASKKSSGRGSRKEIVKQHQAAEKRTGEKLSPDRKDNNKGYASKNVRSIPEKLNRGRHKADEKKLAEWRKSVKKALINVENTLYKGAKDLDKNPMQALEQVPNPAGESKTQEAQSQGADTPVQLNNTESVTEDGQKAGFSGGLTPTEKTPASLSPKNQALFERINPKNSTKDKIKQDKIAVQSAEGAGPQTNPITELEDMERQIKSAYERGDWSAVAKIGEKITAHKESKNYTDFVEENKNRKKTESIVRGQNNNTGKDKGIKNSSIQNTSEQNKQDEEDKIARTSADTLTGKNFDTGEEKDIIQTATAGGAVDTLNEKVLGEINEGDKKAQSELDATKTMFERTGAPATPNQDILNAIKSGSVKVGKQLSSLKNFLATFTDQKDQAINQALEEMGLDKGTKMLDMSDEEKLRYIKIRNKFYRKAYANTLETEYNKAVDAKKTQEQKDFEQKTSEFNTRSTEFNPDSVIENGLNISKDDNADLYAAVQNLRGRDPNGRRNRRKPLTAEGKYEAIENVKKELVNHFGKLGASFDNVKMSLQELNDMHQEEIKNIVEQTTNNGGNIEQALINFAKGKRKEEQESFEKFLTGGDLDKMLVASNDPKNKKNPEAIAKVVKELFNSSPHHFSGRNTAPELDVPVSPAETQQQSRGNSIMVGNETINLDADGNYLVQPGDTQATIDEMNQKIQQAKNTEASPPASKAEANFNNMSFDAKLNNFSKLTTEQQQATLDQAKALDSRALSDDISSVKSDNKMLQGTLNDLDASSPGEYIIDQQGPASSTETFEVPYTSNQGVKSKLNVPSFFKEIKDDLSPNQLRALSQINSRLGDSVGTNATGNQSDIRNRVLKRGWKKIIDLGGTNENIDMLKDMMIPAGPFETYKELKRIEKDVKQLEQKQTLDEQEKNKLNGYKNELNKERSKRLINGVDKAREEAEDLVQKMRALVEKKGDEYRKSIESKIAENNSTIDSVNEGKSFQERVEEKMNSLNKSTTMSTFKGINPIDKLIVLKNILIKTGNK